MRIATEFEIKNLLKASETGEAYLPLMPQSPETRRLDSGISPKQVIQATEAFLEDWVCNISISPVADLLKGLDIGFALVPNSEIRAGYATDSGIIGIHSGFIRFIRHHVAHQMLTVAAERVKNLAGNAQGADPCTLAAVQVKLDRALETVGAWTFEFALEGRAESEPLHGMLSGQAAARVDVVADLMLTFGILHEYGHSLVRGHPLPDIPPRFDEHLVLPLEGEIKIKQYEEYMADCIACQLVPKVAARLIPMAATAFLGLHCILEDLCYHNRQDHPPAANRIALLLHYADMDERSKEVYRGMVDLGQSVASRRRYLGEDELLVDRQRRTKNYVAACRIACADPTSIVKALCEEAMPPDKWLGIVSCSDPDG